MWMKINLNQANQKPFQKTKLQITCETMEDKSLLFGWSVLFFFFTDLPASPSLFHFCAVLFHFLEASSSLFCHKSDSMSSLLSCASSAACMTERQYVLAWRARPSACESAELLIMPRLLGRRVRAVVRSKGLHSWWHLSEMRASEPFTHLGD